VRLVPPPQDQKITKVDDLLVDVPPDLKTMRFQNIASFIALMDSVRLPVFVAITVLPVWQGSVTRSSFHVSGRYDSLPSLPPH